MKGGVTLGLFCFQTDVRITMSNKGYFNKYSNTGCSDMVYKQGIFVKQQIFLWLLKKYSNQNKTNMH